MTPFGSPVIGGQKPSPEGNICAPIMHFQCKNNFEHLLTLAKRSKCGGDTCCVVILFLLFVLHSEVIALGNAQLNAGAVVGWGNVGNRETGTATVVLVENFKRACE